MVHIYYDFTNYLGLPQGAILIFLLAVIKTTYALSCCNKKLNMENSSNKNLEVSKDFNVEKGKLYQAWIGSEELKKWWKPEDLILEKVENDIQLNGKILYLFKSEKGGEVRVSGEYLEVVPKEKLKYSWNWELPELNNQEDGKFILTIRFLDVPQGSRLEVTQESFPNDEALSTHRNSWESALSSLFNFLSGANISAENKNANENISAGKPGVNNDIEKTGYNEIADQEKVGGYS